MSMQLHGVFGDRDADRPAGQRARRIRLYTMSTDHDNGHALAKARGE